MAMPEVVERDVEEREQPPDDAVERIEGSCVGPVAHDGRVRACRDRVEPEPAERMAAATAGARLSHAPRAAPCVSTASRAYSEHDGMYRHGDGRWALNRW